MAGAGPQKTRTGNKRPAANLLAVTNRGAAELLRGRLAPLLEPLQPGAWKVGAPTRSPPRGGWLAMLAGDGLPPLQTSALEGETALSYQVVVLAGDGIGPEIMEPTLEALGRLCAFSFSHHLIGGAAIDRQGVPLTEETLEAARRADAVLLGAVGGPRWDTTDPAAPRPEQGLLSLRAGLSLYANLRPVKPLPALYGASPLRRELIEGVDLVVVRELTGGIYFGEKERTAERASDLCVYTVAEVERIARRAFTLARSRVTSVDKANVLETSRLWREVVSRVQREEFPHIGVEHQLVDSAAMKLLASPRHFDVILTENMFGDILSDEAAMLSGSLGMLPSASLGTGEGQRCKGLFEPIHGSAPDIAGKGIANPYGMLLSGALMLRYAFGREEEAAALESAVRKALDAGARTPDLGGEATTAQAARVVLDHL